MAVRLSRFYNDEGIGRGFQNIAGALAPPSADDQLAGQKALEIKEKAGRIAQLFDNPNDPSFDRRATVAGLQTGSQSLEAVGMNNATARTTNAADNVRALQQTRLQQAGETDRTMLAPVSQDQVRFVPGRIADMYGVSEQQYGPASLAQGETVVRPDGARLEGASKPVTETEAKGAAFNRLGPDDMRRIVMNGAGTQNAIVDGQSRVVYGADAADRGLAPAATPTAPTFVGNYDAGNGATGPAVLDNGRIVNPQSREAIPANAQVRSAAVTGTPDQFGKTTEAQDRYALALKMTDEPTRIIDSAFATGKLPTGSDDAIRALSNVAPGAVGTLIAQQMSPEAQSFHNAIKNAVPYQLLALSGQGVTEAEYERTMARMIPFANDTPEVKAQKRNQFNTFRDGIRGLAGPAAAKVGVGAAPAEAASTAPAGSRQPVRVSSPAEARALPKGTPILLPDGSTGVVP